MRRYCASTWSGSTVGKLRKIFSSVRIWIVILALLMMLIALRPNPIADGVVIKSVTRNSSASLAGIENPQPTLAPSALERIITINGKEVADVQAYHGIVDTLPINRTVTLRTTRATYRLTVRPRTETIVLNETVNVTEIVQRNRTINGTTSIVNETVTKEVPKTETRILGAEPLGLAVVNTPTSNLRKGLELQGGIRVLLQPAEPVSEDTLLLMVDSLKQRLNVFGLSDIIVSPVSDLEGDDFILVEIAGATEQQARELLAKQGKFEATIGNTTVFRGGQDITYVCRTAECSGIDPNRGCSPATGGWACSYFFGISLSPAAAEHHADITRNLTVIGIPPEDYLSENLSMYLDDQRVRELRIGSSLRGVVTTEVQISGFGYGISEQEAVTNTLQDMKQLQTIIATGSLPSRITLVKVDTISPTLGTSFTRNALVMGGLAVLAVTLVLLVRYRRLSLALPIMFTSLAEIFLTLGCYALFGWSLDLAAIAGIIVAVGTGVNDQIIITDETLRGESEGGRSWKDRIKRAFSIILAAYFTMAFAMIPLIFAGAGLLRGFAITTIVGVTFGVLITRPAFGKLIEILLENDDR